MNYARFEAVLREWEEAYRPLRDPEAAAPFGLRRQAPAAPETITALEKTLGTPLPPSLRDFFLRYSGRLSFSAFLDDAFCGSLPAALRGIFSAGAEISPEGIAAAEAARRGWIKSCFSDPADAYGGVFHGKLGLIAVGNGDVIACDLRDGQKDHRIVYLSHDDGEGHGRVLGRSFADFLERWAAVGLCGPEDWQWLPFIGEAETGLDPGCPNAAAYRGLVLRHDAAGQPAPSQLQASPVSAGARTHL